MVGRHCVAVGTMPRRVRLVHLSDMNVGDLGAPDFDARLIDEVNLVSPTLIVATGDYLDAMHDDVGQGWQRIADFFSRFDAPALLACGDHDDPESYGRVVAASLAGTISVGELRGVVLFDVPGRPISDDVEQIRWLEQALAVPGDDRLAFVVAHDESPNLLRAWQRRGVLGDMIKATRLGVWFAGGHRDWDGVEYRALVDGASPMLYLRTHESSEAVRDGATGISHYRIVDLTRERAWLPGAELDELRPSESVPVGRLSVSLAAPNDGSRTCVAITAVNNLPYRVDRLGVRVVLKRTEGATPWCLGGELESAEPVGDCWECRVRFDLPDKGAVQGLVGGGPQPAQPKVEVLFDTVRQLHLTQRASRDGLVFQTAPETLALIHLHNAGTSAAAVTPLVRLDGEALSYTVLDEPGPAAAAYRLRLAPGAMLTLQVDLTAIRVAPGVRELQVYLKGPAVWSPACCPLEVSVGPQ